MDEECHTSTTLHRVHIRASWRSPTTGLFILRSTGRRDKDAAGEGIKVRISGMRFEPASITVKPGTTVTWIHESPMPHTITGNAGSLGSGTLYSGQTYSHTFEEDGLFNYYCGIHPSMTGSVLVEAAADS